jgi:hypothetical protein
VQELFRTFGNTYDVGTFGLSAAFVAAAQKRLEQRVAEERK